ncbi:DUF6286 domain-containing protein [Nesterenkonia sp. HG001]|uniref:DUF6286 domain-containing protein n=1 Tax=Nesterenkonia sp. HG001 TaxID=2983207 RepID=UPI002AC4F1F1|nr:DUF6286 domain-containing protein [Nesterenkonia sp. HG001]MDZ5076969.1 DUF6286 domain-containing protein [Nesterenkonia sp. HG001]
MRRDQVIRRRPQRVIAAWIVGIVLLMVAGLTGWVSALLLAGESVPPLETAGTLSWGSPVVLTLGALLLLVGVLVLCAAIWPGRPVVHGIAPSSGTSADHVGDLTYFVTSRGLGRLAEGEARRTDGVTSAGARSTGRRISVVARSDAAELAETRREIQERIDRRVRTLQPRVRHRVTVHVRSGGTS